MVSLVLQIMMLSRYLKKTGKGEDTKLGVMMHRELGMRNLELGGSNAGSNRLR